MPTSSITESVGLFHAKTHLSELVERVAQGESIAITKHGKRVAFLIPAERKPKKDPKKLVEELIEMSRGIRLGEGETIKDLIEEGRKR